MNTWHLQSLRIGSAIDIYESLVKYERFIECIKRMQMFGKCDVSLVR